MNGRADVRKPNIGKEKSLFFAREFICFKPVKGRVGRKEKKTVLVVNVLNFRLCFGCIPWLTLVPRCLAVVLNKRLALLAAWQVLVD